MKLFVFGLGYSATSAVNQLAPHCIAQGGWVSATTRSAQKAEKLSDSGLRAHVFSGEKPGDERLRQDITSATHVIISISPGENDPVLAHHAEDIKASKALQWIGYYSTVGVYGDHQGAWVDEAGDLRPVSRRSIERVAAEEAWCTLAKECDVPIALLRLAGIYGPGRNGFVNLEAGKARRIVKPGQVFNRIHVSDIGRISEAMALRKANGVFNGADNEPAPPQDVVEYAARLMDVPVPPDIDYDTANMSPMGRSFYGETKRVSNKRLLSDLDIELQYPTYRDAFDALWQSNTWRDLPLLKKLR
ncbi:MAG: SDR family oxidoreductase [Hyphomicrobiales bacterium]